MKVGRNKGLFIKILSSIILCVLIIFISSGFIIEKRTIGIVTELNYKNLESEAKAAANQISEFFSGYGVLLEQIHTNQDIIKYMNGVKTRDEVRTNEEYTDVVKAINKIQGTDENLALVWVALKDANYLVTNNEWDCPNEWDINSKDWYTEVLKLEKGKILFTEPYVDSVTGKMVVSVVQAIYDNAGKNVGAVGIDLMIDELPSIMESYTIGKTGYLFLLSQKGETVYHPNSEYVLKTRLDESGGELGKIAQSMVNQESGVGTYKDKGIDKYVGYYPVSANGWSVAACIDKGEFMEDVGRVKNALTIIYIGGIAIMVVLIFLITKSITKPIKDLENYGEKIGNLDLTQDVPEKLLKRQDEIGSLANVFKTIRLNLVNFIKTISDSSSDLSASSEELSSIINQTTIASDEIARTIEEIAKGASDQARETEQGATGVSILGDKIGENQNMMVELNTALGKVELLKNEGLKILDILVEKTKNSERASKQVNDVIVEANISADKISGASQMIKSIAEQTSLLSLNAAIEAARAGEEGRGFAVVADEIRKLAEQSNAFTDEISEVIRELSNKTNSAVSTMEEVGKIVLDQTNSVYETKTKFDGISDSIDSIAGILDELNKIEVEMENQKTEIISAIENLSAISQENAAGTEEASASVEEQNAAMNEIADASENLAKLAEDMIGSISKFKY
ncbi:methyl-accepting chemotaxis protein [Sporanaerobacter acetigenes]|uniref:Methyl-accepting chemotaxis sensory transducer with Cache sensor n=1 Tax=Sporanaerobacter acetigenes DSM 13106 TaxID=1123281 RepID=A0A1M5SPG6_9FIRM|nr:methyl-accepting chemotaxis protein [Sporanaerobacter acetigenes]SHH40449.1 methyl-accepting chemotaxis sensory transducer with Cache sensor [Sporanaerobacter acetigenes DSM 13106]